MTVDNEAKRKRINDCRELYIKYRGQHHTLIEREMRGLGHLTFHRRIMYDRFERGHYRPGWIERFRWRNMSEPPAAAGGLTRHFDPLAALPQRTAERLYLSESSERDSRGSASGGGAAPKPASRPHGEAKPHRNADGQRPDESGVSRRHDFDEFQEWLKLVSPGMTWDWPYQVHIYKHLKKVTDGLCKRLMVFVPPRHGKSEMVTVRYTAWRMKRDPSMNIIVGSYNQRLANRFSRKVRRVLCDDAVLTAETQSRGESEIEIDATGSNGSSAKTDGDSKQANESARRLRVSAVDSADAPDSPFPFVQSRPSNSEAEWETTKGGGFRAVGVGSGVAGFGANLIIIDDPTKSRAEAESQTYRDNLADWFNDDIYTRLEPDGAIILIQTRWHEDDLAGRLLKESLEEGGEHWDVINLPALAENDFTAETQRRGGEIDQNSSSNASTSDFAGAGQDETAKQPDITRSDLSSQCLGGSAVQASLDPLNRKPGAALCPARFDEKALERLRRKLGSYSFAALYQQRPVPAEGGLFKRSWFKIVPSAPPDLKWKRGYDPGISTKADADYTASLRVAYDKDGNMYIDGGYRKRMEYPELRKYILGRILAERDTEHGVELSANGNAIVQDLRREPSVRGRAFRGIKVTDSKISRALPWIALAEEGRVFLVRGPWTAEFIDEASAFPSGTHDDQIDAVSIAVRMCQAQKNRGYGFVIW